MIQFQKAEKKKVKLKLGITGPSGSGKTFSALRLAKGLGYNKIAVIDSESGSASLYADKFDFDVLELKPPYTTEKYIEAMQAAIGAGYDVLIVDSLSHAWAGEGGILQQKEQLDARGGNSFQNWGKMTPKQEKLVATILHSPIHIICTMRSKQEYIVETNERGKQAPRKVGLAPIQRDGFEYELTAVLDVAINHEAQASKDRTGLFSDNIFQITEKTGETLLAWLNSGKELLPHVQKLEDEKCEGNEGISEEPTSESDWGPGDYVCQIGKKYVNKRIKEIPVTELREHLEWLRSNAEKNKKPLFGLTKDYYNNAMAYLESLSPEPPMPPEPDLDEALA